VDAVLVGAQTVRADNPRLTVRGLPTRQQPWRVVLTRSGRLPSRAHLFSDGFAKRTLVYSRKSLAAVLKDLGKKNVTSVLIEGGGDILGQALDARLIDKVQLYLGPILTGGPGIAFAGVGASDAIQAIRFDRISYRRIGQSVCVTACPKLISPNKPGNLPS
jgi:diaminohydroxyphosphoribosylaminopyrimidine deaminase/5-amino-6-(5-phosphoribosylamino)uracil reductase